MHPSEFFDNCSILTGIDTIEIYDRDLKDKLKSIHPKNFLKTKITLPVYKINLSYMTEKNNYKTVDRYAILDSKDEDEYVDFWIDTHTGLLLRGRIVKQKAEGIGWELFLNYVIAKEKMEARHIFI